MSNVIKFKNKTTTGTSLDNLTDREALVNDADLKAFVRIAGNIRQFLFDEDLKGGARSLQDRLNVISSFASPNTAGLVPGQYYDNSFHGAASASLMGAADRIELSPYYTSDVINIDRIGCGVSIGVLSSLFRVVIYSSNSTSGWPENLLYESNNLSGATAAFAEASLAFTFKSGTKYWLGIRHSGMCTLRTVPVTSALNLGLLSNNASSYATVLRRTLVFNTLAPETWSFVDSDRAANITPPSVRFRVV
jgi:hypothetical protein